MPINNQITFRKGSSSLWTSTNPILASGEPGYETDTGRFKIGNGSNWNSTNYTAVVPSGFIAGTGISISLGSNGSTATITSTGSGILSDQAKSLVTTVFNNTGSSIAKMTAVYINGGQGDTATIQKAIATGDLTSAGTYGLTYQNIDNMSTGQVIVFGALTGVNTDQFNPTAPTGNINGTVLYLSPTTSGALTTSKPSAPNHIVTIGTVVRTHQNEGVIEVRVQNGFELDELHNVAISGVTNGQFLQYNTASGLWLASSSGNFTTLQVNGTGVSVSGHSHSLSGLGAAAYQDTNVFPSYNDPGQSSVTVAAGLWDPANALSWLHGFDGEVYIESFFVDSFRNSISAAPSSHSHGNITNSGAIGSASGLLVITTTSGLLTTTSGVSSSYITNFNTAVSGLLPTVTNSGDNRILTSTGSSVGVNAESNLIYDGSALKLYPGNEYPSITLVSNPADASDGINPISWYVTSNDLNTNIVKIDVSTESSPSEGMLVFHTNDGTSLQERVRITDIGRVGIGTSTPSSSLQVVGLITANSGNFTNSLQLNGTGVSISGHTHSISDINILTSSDLAARISDETGSGLLVFNDSPTLTGVPLAPTAASGTNTNQIASTAFVRTEISNLVASAPATLDTLNELATALGNDANFSTTVTNNLAGKANLSGATFSGTISAPTGNFTGNVNIASQTASTIAGFDASKNVTSLSTSTYPSLTELSYVKGASSSIQTQLDNFAGKIGKIIDSSDDSVAMSFDSSAGGWDIEDGAGFRSAINFNSAVSGLLPTITNSGDNRVLTSTGSSVGVNAESNLTFNGSSLAVSGDIQVDNLKLDGNTLSSTFSDVNIISSGDIYLGPFDWGFGITPKDIGCPVAAKKIYIAENLFLGETNDDPTLGIALNYAAGANNLTIYTHPNQGGGAVFSATGGVGVDMQGPVTIGPFGGDPNNGVASLNITGNLIVSGSGLLPSNINNFDEAVDDRVNNLLVPGLGIDISYNDNANTVTISDNTTATVGAALYLWANFR